jgi:hypothetical protein
MRHRPSVWIVSAVSLGLGLTLGLAQCLAAPAEGKKASKHNKPSAAAVTHAAKHRGAAVAARPGYWGQGTVRAGPFHNGQDYLGDDPDPNIRSQIQRDMGGRYGGND